MSVLINIFIGAIGGFVFSMLWWNADLSEYLWFLFGAGTGFACCFIGYRMTRKIEVSDEKTR